MISSRRLPLRVSVRFAKVVAVLSMGLVWGDVVCPDATSCARGLYDPTAPPREAGGGEGHTLKEAQFCLGRVDRLATLAYNRLHPGLDEGPGDNSDYLAWRRCFLVMDPEGVVSATLRATRGALAQPHAAQEQAQLLSIQAHALCMLGQHAGEVEALVEARQLAPHPEGVDLRLAHAYAECRRFREAMRVASARR